VSEPTQIAWRTSGSGLSISLSLPGQAAIPFAVSSGAGSLVLHPGTLSTDFLALAAAVYALDRVIPRAAAEDGWSRFIPLEISVHHPAAWKRTAAAWEHMLGFLTGDTWSLRFSRQTTDSHVGAQSHLEDPASGMALLSGGLDSLIGAIDWLESNKGSLALVSHYDQAMSGPKGEQAKIVAALKDVYGDRLLHLQWRAGLAQKRENLETTFRGRSLLFVALMACSAGDTGYQGPTIIPENGNIALNMPLTPSRVGSCSTRTAHPYYLQLLNSCLASMGFDISVMNPYEAMSKGQMAIDCRSQSTLDATRNISVSSAKRGHRREWTNRTARACGVCMPCIYRRASLHAAAKDDEQYGIDFSLGQLKLDADIAADLRAYLLLLSENLDEATVVDRLVASSPLPYARVVALAPAVQSAMREVRALVQDKGTARMRTLAGIDA